VCAAIAAPFLAADSDAFLSTWRWSADRIPWESTWAWMFPGHGTRYPVANLPEIRSPQLIEQQFAQPYPTGDEAEPRGNSVNLITVALGTAATLVAGFFLARARRRNLDFLADAGAATRMTLVFLLILMVFSKGFSSYFLVWAAPLICAACPGAGGFALCGLLVVLGNTELLGILADNATIAAARANFEGNSENLRYFNDCLKFYTRLGSPYVLFWRSIWFRWLMLAAVAGYQMNGLLRNRETTQ